MGENSVQGVDPQCRCTRFCNTHCCPLASVALRLKSQPFSLLRRWQCRPRFWPSAVNVLEGSQQYSSMSISWPVFVAP